MSESELLSGVRAAKSSFSMKVLIAGLFTELFLSEVAVSDTAFVCQNAFLCNVVQHTKTMEVT